MKRMRWLAVLAVFALVVAACGGDDDGTVDESSTTAAAPATTDAVDPVQSSDLTFHMVTHSDDGVFWSVMLSETLLALVMIWLFRRGRWKQRVV